MSAAVPLNLGPAITTAAGKGVIVRLYNEGMVGLFQADNGPVFTIDSRDLQPKQPALSAKEIVAELHRIFRKPLREDLQWS
jgi:hypothetical protein